MGKQFLDAYRRGFKDGKRAGEQLVATDVNFIAGCLALILSERGFSTDEIAQLIEDLQRKWEEECGMELCAFLDKVSEQSGIELRVR